MQRLVILLGNFAEVGVEVFKIVLMHALVCFSCPGMYILLAIYNLLLEYG